MRHDCTRLVASHAVGRGATVRSEAATRRLLAAALVVSVVTFASHFIPDAIAQANSDFVAYPKSMVRIDELKRDTRQLTFNRLPGLSPDYRLGPGDEIEVTVVGVSEGAQRHRIDSTGSIVIPPLGRLKVGDLTAEEAEQAIAAHFRRRDLINEPEVLVYISSYEAKPVYVVGELDRPGEYMMSQQLTVMDLIFVAGGVDLTAARYAYLHRRVAGDGPTGPPVGWLNNPELARPGTEVVKIDLQPMKEGSVLSPNFPLRKGDVLIVPRRSVDVFYVIGDVGFAGAFEVPSDTRIMVSQAISMAAGPTKTAKMSEGMLVRYGEDGSRQEVPVDFAAILDGRRPDLEVRPNDVIFIPGSEAKTLGYGLLTSIPGLVAGALIF